MKIFKRLAVYAITISFVVILAWALSQTRLLQRLDSVFMDMAMSTSLSNHVDDIAIIVVDTPSLKAHGNWPWARMEYATLLTKLQALNAAPVVFDILFSEPDPSQISDALFADAIRAHGRVVLAMSAENDHTTGDVRSLLPQTLLLNAAASIGHTDVFIDTDGIARGIYLGEGLGNARWPALSLAALYATDSKFVTRWPRKNAEVVARNKGADWVRGQEVLLPFQQASFNFPVFSYTEVMAGKFNDALKNKIIFIGVTAQGLDRVFATPIGMMTGVVFQANAYQALRHNQLAIQDKGLSFWLYLIGLAMVSFIAMRLLAIRYQPFGFIAAIATSAIVGVTVLYLVQVALPVVSIWASLFVLFLLEAAKRLNDLSNASRRDSLTGLYNRRAFDTNMVQAWQHITKEQILYLLVIDVDFFKNVNDTLGHQRGDEVLIDIAAALVANTRQASERVHRIGGEEFCIILSEASSEHVKEYAERLRNVISTTVSPALSVQLKGPITVSIGCAKSNQLNVKSERNLFREADRALYIAKNSGRNQVTCAWEQD